MWLLLLLLLLLEFWGFSWSLLWYTLVSVLGIGIARGQYDWVLDIGCLSWYCSNPSTELHLSSKKRSLVCWLKQTVQTLHDGEIAYRKHCNEGSQLKCSREDTAANRKKRQQSHDQSWSHYQIGIKHNGHVINHGAANWNKMQQSCDQAWSSQSEYNIMVMWSSQCSQSEQSAAVMWSNHFLLLVLTLHDCLHNTQNTFNFLQSTYMHPCTQVTK